MGPKILIIEDEPAIADTLVYALETEGFEPRWSATGAGGLAALAQEGFALVVLDIGLPDGNGFDFCRRIRAHSDVPILFLTARSGEVDRIVGLEIGGDDYLVKPFSPRELTARVRAILRRVRPAEPVRATATAPAFSIDEARCQIHFQGRPLDLTRCEFRLLSALVGQPGRVFSREQLLQAAWDEPEASLDRTVDAHVKSLRAKLRAVDAAQDPIQTHRGLGYSLRETPAP